MVVEHIIVGLKVDLLGQRMGRVENFGLKVLHVANYTISVNLIIEAEEILHDFKVINILEDFVHGSVICKILLCEEFNHIVIVYAR